MRRIHKQRGHDKDDGYILQVNEIFSTIQGEGPFAGQPAIFIRLTGCNLQCTFCDTTWDDHYDHYHHVDVVVIEVEALLEKQPWIDLVVITGGEPTRQTLAPLLNKLVERDLYVQLETAGSFWEDVYAHPLVSIVVSPKVAKVHPKMIENAHSWKYIVKAGCGLNGLATQPKAGGGWPYVPSIKAFQARRHVASSRPAHTHIYVQPMDEGDPLKNQANAEYCGKLAIQCGYRVSVQMHKVLGIR
tara:strand:- start:136 stop:867 length:732 start_codon:yes stop_codon:yes gene_type:complete